MPSALPTRPIDATLSVTKAARMLGVHPNTVRAWSDAGRLRYYRINPRGDRRYRLGDLQRFLAAAEGSPDVMWVDPETADVVPRPTGPPGAHVPVIVTPDAKAAKDEQCPSCGRPDGIRFLGSRVATLASTTLGQLFGSPDIAVTIPATCQFLNSNRAARDSATKAGRGKYHR